MFEFTGPSVAPNGAMPFASLRCSSERSTPLDRRRSRQELTRTRLVQLTHFFDSRFDGAHAVRLAFVALVPNPLPRR